MSYDPIDAMLATRARALTLEVVAVTGTFAGTATGYSRTTGSFLDDGFEIGQEVYGTGFALSDNLESKVVTGVTALTLTTQGIAVASNGDRTLESGSGTVVESAGTRTLTVGMPGDRDSANVRLNPGAGVPWWREEWSPSPGARRIGIGPNARLEYDIDYFITLFLPSNTGTRAAGRYAKAVLDLFAPGQTIGLTDADSSLRVRGDTAPWAGSFLQSVAPVAGFLVVPVTVPLTLWTANSI